MPTSFWRRGLAAALLAAPLLTWAQADPPARVVYLSALDGTAQVAGNGLADWAPAPINWPLTGGNQLALAPGARAELQGGTVVARAAGPASLSMTALDDHSTQLAVTEGSLALHVRSLRSGERVEIDTPQLALVATQPGDYRVDVDPAADTTRVTLRAGAATLYGEAGQAMSAAAGEQLLVAGRQLRVLRAAGAGARDGFDQWVAARTAQEDRSASARYLPRGLPGYAELDAHGQWADDPTYGAVWYPQVASADWAPYRYGQWAWVEPWGWTWIDDAPWGFAPSHYGRWAQIGPRWAWVPGSFGPQPVYAPALVAFVGASGGNASWSLGLAGGRPGAAWFPLAPGEYWSPGYRASDRYRQQLNWGDGPWRPRPPAPGGYLFQHRPGAISVGPVGPGPGGRFDGGPGRPPRFGDGSRLPPGALNGASVVPPPRGPADAGRPGRPGQPGNAGPGRPPMLAPPATIGGPGAHPGEPPRFFGQPPSAPQPRPPAGVPIGLDQPTVRPGQNRPDRYDRPRPPMAAPGADERPPMPQRPDVDRPDVARPPGGRPAQPGRPDARPADPRPAAPIGLDAPPHRPAHSAPPAPTMPFSEAQRPWSAPEGGQRERRPPAPRGIDGAAGWAPSPPRPPAQERVRSEPPHQAAPAARPDHEGAPRRERDRAEPRALRVPHPRERDQP